MTRNQLFGLYWESFRQEARTQLGDIKIKAIMAGGDASKTSLAELERQASPPDPESDGDFDHDDVIKLQSAMGAIPSGR